MKLLWGRSHHIYEQGGEKLSQMTHGSKVTKYQFDFVSDFTAYFVLRSVSQCQMFLGGLLVVLRSAPQSVSPKTSTQTEQSIYICVVTYSNEKAAGLLRQRTLVVY